MVLTLLNQQRKKYRFGFLTRATYVTGKAAKKVGFMSKTEFSDISLFYDDRFGIVLLRTELQSTMCKLMDFQLFRIELFLEMRTCSL
jgi:hypothetical protein